MISLHHTKTHVSWLGYADKTENIIIKTNKVQNNFVYCIDMILFIYYILQSQRISSFDKPGGLNHNMTSKKREFCMEFARRFVYQNKI